MADARRGRPSVWPLLLGVVTLCALATCTSTTGTGPGTGPQGSPPPSVALDNGKDFGVFWSGFLGGYVHGGRVDHGNAVGGRDLASLRYYRSKGLTIVRFPVLWERLQPTWQGALSADAVADVIEGLRMAEEAGVRVILDVHNYARYPTLDGRPLTRTDALAFADLWQRLAHASKDESALYGYELMNEPHDLPGGSSDWAVLAQAAVDAIRQVDTAHWILAPGYSGQNAFVWPQENPGYPLSDPAGRTLYSAHLYFDDFSGSYRKGYAESPAWPHPGVGAYPDIGVDRLRPFLGWLAEHHVRGFISEYGVPADGRWLEVLDRTLAAIDADARIQGGTAGLAGPVHPTDAFAATWLEPVGGGDRPQMAVLARYPSRPPRRP